MPSNHIPFAIEIFCTLSLPCGGTIMTDFRYRIFKNLPECRLIIHNPIRQTGSITILINFLTAADKRHSTRKRNEDSVSNDICILLLIEWSGKKNKFVATNVRFRCFFFFFCCIYLVLFRFYICFCLLIFILVFIWYWYEFVCVCVHHIRVLTLRKHEHRIDIEEKTLFSIIIIIFVTFLFEILLEVEHFIGVQMKKTNENIREKIPLPIYICIYIIYISIST